MSIFSLLNKIESNFQHLNFDLEDYATTYVPANPSIITVNFNANTVGDHYLGYNYIGDVNIQPVVNFNTRYVYDVITVNVTSIGPQTVDIPIYGSLYCANITYFGYVIASCQNQTDSTGNNIPDEAITWSQNLPKQSDPIALTEITCVAVPILTAVISAPPIGCSDGDYPIVVTPANVGDDLITAVGTLTVGSSGSSFFINFTNKGLYKQTPVITIPTLACDPSVAVTVTMFQSSITLSDYIPTNGTISEPVVNSTYLLSVGDTVQMFTDQTITLPDGFESTVISNGHCAGCENLTVDASAATTGSGKVTFNLPWSNINSPLQLKTVPIQAGQITNMGCVIIGTPTYDFGNLDVTPTTATGAC